jgi:hypothetical protein
MRRIHSVSLAATAKESSPPTVWAMTMTMIGAVFGAGSLARSEESVRLNLRRGLR